MKKDKVIIRHTGNVCFFLVFEKFEVMKHDRKSRTLGRSFFSLCFPFFLIFCTRCLPRRSIHPNLGWELRASPMRFASVPNIMLHVLSSMRPYATYIWLLVYQVIEVLKFYFDLAFSSVLILSSSWYCASFLAIFYTYLAVNSCHAINLWAISFQRESWILVFRSLRGPATCSSTPK